MGKERKRPVGAGSGGAPETQWVPTTAPDISSDVSIDISVIEEKFEALDGAVEATKIAATRLMERISMVSQPIGSPSEQKPCNEFTSSERGSSPLAASLDELHKQVSQIEQDLLNAVARLEI